MIVIIGAGGHGQVVADIFRARRQQGLASDITVFVDDQPFRQGQLLAGSRVVGTVDELAALAHDAIVVAIGDNRARARMFARFAAGGAAFAVAAHPRSVLAEDVAIGRGSMLSAATVVNTGSVIGQNTIINTGATVDHHNVIGDHVHIAPGVHLGGEVNVQDGAFVGIGAIVLPRVTIGAWSTVGAGAVVTRDVPPGVTVLGAPAKAVNSAADVHECVNL